MSGVWPTGQLLQSGRNRDKRNSFTIVEDVHSVLVHERLHGDTHLLKLFERGICGHPAGTSWTSCVILGSEVFAWKSLPRVPSFHVLFGLQ